MNRIPSEQLMTIEEAERLSALRPRRNDRRERQKIWIWQCVDGAMTQRVSDEQIERMAAIRAIKTRD